MTERLSFTDFYEENRNMDIEIVIQMISIITSYELLYMILITTKTVNNRNFEKS